MFFWSKPGIHLMEKALDASALRQKVIAHNVSNVDTPHFKRSEVRFEDVLQQQLQAHRPLEGYRTDPRHFYIGGRPPSGPDVVKDEFSSMNNNMNNVDIDYEMSQMAKNQLRYNVMIQEVNSEIKKLRTVIEGRR